MECSWKTLGTNTILENPFHIDGHNCTLENNTCTGNLSATDKFWITILRSNNTVKGNSIINTNARGLKIDSSETLSNITVNATNHFVVPDQAIRIIRNNNLSNISVSNNELAACNTGGNWLVETDNCVPGVCTATNVSYTNNKKKGGITLVFGSESGNTNFSTDPCP